ncbi:hypothetical protein LCGC14_2546350 [marine sediment metagenome]|uniref:Uncharacterized protein n=1 Tax=marine sediment metagenome TaxID=412755 RepID=A0A0F9D0N9_9ZZZZ
MRCEVTLLAYTRADGLLNGGGTIKEGINT